MLSLKIFVGKNSHLVRKPYKKKGVQPAPYQVIVQLQYYIVQSRGTFSSSRYKFSNASISRHIVVVGLQSLNGRRGTSSMEAPSAKNLREGRGQGQRRNKTEQASQRSRVSAYLHCRSTGVRPTETKRSTPWRQARVSA